jgi:hypothetical protein
MFKDWGITLVSLGNFGQALPAAAELTSMHLTSSEWPCTAMGHTCAKQRYPGWSWGCCMCIDPILQLLYHIHSSGSFHNSATAPNPTNLTGQVKISRGQSSSVLYISTIPKQRKISIFTHSKPNLNGNCKSSMVKKKQVYTESPSFTLIV